MNFTKDFTLDFTKDFTQDLTIVGLFEILNRNSKQIIENLGGGEEGGA